jgi:hypothetical protein
MLGKQSKSVFALQANASSTCALDDGLTGNVNAQLTAL